MADKENAWEVFADRVDTMSDELYEGLNKNVREWYHEAFPTDDIYKIIKPYTTFYDVVDRLYCKGNVYNILVGDSVVRERVFEYLSQYLGLDYDIIYYTWLS